MTHYYMAVLEKILYLVRTDDTAELAAHIPKIENWREISEEVYCSLDIAMRCIKVAIRTDWQQEEYVH